MTLDDINKKLLIVSGYLIAIDILLYLLFNSHIQLSYYLILWTFLQAILLLVLLRAINKQQDTMLVYMITHLYLLTLVLVYFTRFELYPGDSQFDLFMTQTIIRKHKIPVIQGYCPCYFPILHLLTIFLGTFTGKFSPYGIYTIAKVMPIISFFILLITLSSLMLRLSKNFNLKTHPETPLQAFSFLLIFSVPLLMRWIIQYTRTSISLPLFTLVIYSLIYAAISKKTRSSVVLLIVVSLSLIASHPITAAIVGVSFGISTIHDIFVLKTNTRHPRLFLVFSSILLGYWIYVGNMAYPMKNIYGEIVASIHTFFNTSLITYIVNLIFVKNSVNSEYIPKTLQQLIAMYFGLFRVVFILGITVVGIILLYYKSITKKIENKEINIYATIAMGILLIVSSSYLFGAYSITYARTIIYLLLIGSFPIYTTLIKMKPRGVVTILSFSILCIVIFSTPYFYDQTTTLSKWIYFPDPHKGVDYESCQIQRFLDYYHIHTPKWINKYTPENSIIWTSDAIHMYSSILGFGNRYTTYIKDPIIGGSLNVNRLIDHDIDYALITSLDKKCIVLPYSGIFKQINFVQVYYSTKTAIVYSSQDVVLVHIPTKGIKEKGFKIKGIIMGGQQ